MTSDSNRFLLKCSLPLPEPSAGTGFLQISLKSPRSGFRRAKHEPSDRKDMRLQQRREAEEQKAR
ncbi:pentatricopeptide repeat-containing protein [Corchorus olitorius]|uniref:Pentatricopeptide repeat-containing protein n=1 Tax=Corchorus olitorius TaxID=93759 RepID=A0A1R3HZK1_9ROSI|nr:pentatricopeptide repeat-containing protein [Corchorus olitorius]